MFVQVIQGRVVDPGQVHAAHDRWVEEVAPGADRWLGTTAGVSGDADFIGLVRFESEEAARRNDSRPEQAAWWAQTAELFTGEVTMTESGAAYADRGGASADAGFVQVIQRRVSDVARARQILAELSPLVAQFRPEDIGILAVEHDGDRFTVAVYFTSEREARGPNANRRPPSRRCAPNRTPCVSNRRGSTTCGSPGTIRRADRRLERPPPSHHEQLERGGRPPAEPGTGQVGHPLQELARGRHRMVPERV